MKNQTDYNSSTVFERLDSSNMVLEGQYPGFKCYVPAKRTRTAEPQTIHESISEGPPSEGYHRDFHWNIKVGEISKANTPEPEPVHVSANLSVDDLGQFSMGSLSIDLPPQGQAGGSSGQSGSAEGDIPPGFYSANLGYDNIDFKKKYNKAFMEFTLNVAPCKVVPDENDDSPCDCDPDDCDCDCSSNDDNDSYTEPGGSSSSQSSLGEKRTSLLMGMSSSAGKRVTATSNKTNMLWQINFGTFRGLGGIPGGMIEIAVKDFSAKAWSIKSLAYNHPIANKLEKPNGADYLGQPNTVFKSMNGAGYDNYLVQGDGYSMAGIGASTKTTNKARFLANDSLDSENKTEGNRAYVEIMGTNKSSTVYATNSGLPSSYNTWSGRNIPTEEFAHYLDVVRAQDGSIQQIWNLWDGLANIENISSEGYTIALYLARQVQTKNPSTGLYNMEGEPFKIFEIGHNETKNRLIVTEKASAREPYVASWWQTNGAWSMSRGTGAYEIVTLREKEIVGLGKYKITTTIQRGIDGEAVSRTEEFFTSTDEGTLRNKKVACADPIGSVASSMSTDYKYDTAGRRQEMSPQYMTTTGAGAIKSGYDTSNRLAIKYTPWAGGTSKATYTYYKDGAFYDSDIDYQRIVLIKNGNATEYQRIEYSYSSFNHVRRVEKHMTALGSDKTHVEISETWLGSSPNPHAQGRVKMEQGIDGVQTHYSYELDDEFGTLYRRTAETRVNGNLILGQSTRAVNYISEQGNTMRIEDYALLLDNTWSLLDSLDYEYDIENRWIKKTRANGRVTERAMMCCGPLWEKDEDGIRTTYSYNTARQLVEIIRAVTETTPETITSYTKDAMDRILEKRVDVGPMTTITKTSYDLLGRITSFTDELNRITTYYYSEDGLTTTETTPTGATLITKIHPDGTILEQLGTGQRHLIYTVEATTTGIRTTIKTPHAGGENIALLRTMVDGFGKTIKEEMPNKQCEFITTTYTYDEKGHEISRKTGNLAPALYEYDTMGNIRKKTVKLAETPNLTNSRITEWSIQFIKKSDGIYKQINQISYTPEGNPISQQKNKLASFLSAVLADKIETIDMRGNITLEWTEYSSPSKRIIKRKIPNSEIISESLIIDNFPVSQKDTTGTMVSYARSITESKTILIQSDARNNITTIEQDIIGRTVRKIDALDNISTIDYDIATLNPSVITNVDGSKIFYTYDQRGRKIVEYGTAIQPVLYIYDEMDNLVSLTTFRAMGETIVANPFGRTDGDTTSWEYDLSTGLLLKKTYADGKIETYDYNSLNRLEIVMNGRSTMNSRTYAPLTGELLTFICKDGATTKTPPITYAYNHLGMFTSITDGEGIRILTYNDFNQLVGEKIQGLVSTKLAYAYDGLGRSSGYSLMHEGTQIQTVAYTYDGKGRLGTVSMNGIESPFSYGYNQTNGVLETLSYPNTMQRVYTYEEKRDIVVKIDYLRPGSANYPAKVDYSYDVWGRPVTKQDYFNSPIPDLTHAFTYNDRSELIEDSMSDTRNYSYDYDNIGNRIRSSEGATTCCTYDANNLNQYTNIGEKGKGPFLPAYDADGNQNKLQTMTGEWEITYNALNQAIRFKQETKRIECLYDWMSRRVEKTVYDGTSLVSKKRFIYKGYLQIAELTIPNENDSSPVLQKLYLWDPEETVSTRVLVMRHFDKTGANSEDLFLMHDLLKNTIALFGIKAGRRALYEYAPFGTIIKGDGDMALENPFRFSSEYHDDDLGLIYYNYRYFNAKDGRWVGRDLQSEWMEINRYRAFHNNPSNFIDLLGMDTVIIIGSPSLSRDTERHDLNAWNFLNVGLRRAGDALKKCWCEKKKKCDCKVKILIYQPGYDRRTKYNNKVNKKKISDVKTLVNNWTSNAGASKQCADISYQNSGENILDYLGKLEDDSIDQLDYVGHSSDTGLFPEYGSEEGVNDGTQSDTGEALSNDVIQNQKLIESLKGKFKGSGEFNHLGCHGADCAKDMNDQHNINANGASGRTNYDPAGAGGNSARTPSGVDTHYPRTQRP